MLQLCLQQSPDMHTNNIVDPRLDNGGDVHIEADFSGLQ